MTDDPVFYMHANFAIGLLGFILLFGLVSGIVGFIIGGRRAKRGPTRTIEVYEGPGVPF